MRALDVMTPTVISVQPDMTVRDVANAFVQHKISGAPVVDAHGNLVGMVSEGDLIRRAELGTDERQHSWWLDVLLTNLRAEEYVKSHGHLVRDVMTKDVISVEERTSLNEVATLLETEGIKRVPVLRDGKVVAVKP